MDNDSEHKKAKGTKKCEIKRGLKFKNCKCTAEPYPFLVNDAMLASDNPSRFRKFFKKRYIIKS